MRVAVVHSAASLKKGLKPERALEAVEKIGC